MSSLYLFGPLDIKLGCMWLLNQNEFDTPGLNSPTPDSVSGLPEYLKSVDSS